MSFRRRARRQSGATSANRGYGGWKRLGRSDFCGNLLGPEENMAAMLEDVVSAALLSGRYEEAVDEFESHEMIIGEDVPDVRNFIPFVEE